MAAILDSVWFSLVYVITLIFCVVAGYLIARKRYLKKNKIWKSSGVENAIIGFFALLISFTLLSSGNSNKDRVNLVHQHADAIGKLYRESRFLDDSLRLQVKQFLIRLLEIKKESIKVTAIKRPLLDEKSNQLTAAFWEFIIQVAKNDTNKNNEARIVANEIHSIISLNYRIQYSNQERTPSLIMILLIFGSWLIGLLVGFTNGFTPEHHFLVPIIFLILSSLTVLIIRDLDNPNSGLIRPGYNNYVNMLNQIKDQG